MDWTQDEKDVVLMAARKVLSRKPRAQVILPVGADPLPGWEEKIKREVDAFLLEGRRLAVSSRELNVVTGGRRVNQIIVANHLRSLGWRRTTVRINGEKSCGFIYKLSK